MKHSINPYCICCRELLFKLHELEEENQRLSDINAKYSDLMAGGPRTPNTDMIMGALLSGGDTTGLAKKLKAKS